MKVLPDCDLESDFFRGDERRTTLVTFAGSLMKEPTQKSID